MKKSFTDGVFKEKWFFVRFSGARYPSVGHLQKVFAYRWYLEDLCPKRALLWDHKTLWGKEFGMRDLSLGAGYNRGLVF